MSGHSLKHLSTGTHIIQAAKYLLGSCKRSKLLFRVSPRLQLLWDGEKSAKHGSKAQINNKPQMGSPKTVNSDKLLEKRNELGYTAI